MHLATANFHNMKKLASQQITLEIYFSFFEDCWASSFNIRKSEQRYRSWCILGWDLDDPWQTVNSLQLLANFTTIQIIPTCFLLQTGFVYVKFEVMLMLLKIINEVQVVCY